MKIPYAEPGTSVSNKTGAWRQAFKPEVDKACCIKCGMCSRHCPEGCIAVPPTGAEIDYDYCKGCGICASVCPFKAIRMEKEKK